MKYVGTVLAVADVHAARAFYEGLFGLEVYQDYGIHVSFYLRTVPAAGV